MKVRGLIPGKTCAELVWPSSRVSGLPRSQPTVAPKDSPTTTTTTSGLKTELRHSSAKHYFSVSLYLTMMWKVKAFHNIQTTKEGCYSAPLPLPEQLMAPKMVRCSKCDTYIIQLFNFYTSSVHNIVTDTVNKVKSNEKERVSAVSLWRLCEIFPI